MALVHKDAPRGTKVYSIKAYLLDNKGIKKPVMLYIRGPDKSTFRIVGDSIQVKSPSIAKPVGYRYIITIAAVTNQNQRRKKASIPMKIMVSEVNKYKPKFVPHSLIGEVSRYARPGTMVGKLAIVDADEEKYNRDSLFSLKEGLYKKFVEVDASSGEIQTTNLLLGFRDHFLLGVMATNKGSPMLHTTANMTIFIRNISGNILLFLSVFSTISLFTYRRCRANTYSV